MLTILGIIIGISAIIATFAIGKGAAEKTRQKLLAMGDNYIAVYSGSWLHEGKTTMKKRKRFKWLTFKDVEIFQKLCPNIKHISPVISHREVVAFRENNIFVNIKSGTEDFIKILDRKILRGSGFNVNQAKRGARVAVLGYKSAKELFNSLDPIGQIVRIKEVPFTVVGIMEKIENYRGVHDPNFDILIPIKAMKKHIRKSSDQSVHMIVMSAPTKEEMPRLVQHIRKIMRFQRKLKEEEPDNFTVVDQASIMKVAQSATATIQLLLLIIASISLLVGGIGIMNIMLVSVTERTKEIGIRMALGANSRIILKQFLVEAITLCFIGGIIGIVLGIAAPYVVAHFTGWNPIVTLDSIFIAFLTTSLIGIFFGFYPARKAAKLDPVIALAER